MMKNHFFPFFVPFDKDPNPCCTGFQEVGPKIAEILESGSKAGWLIISTLIEDSTKGHKSTQILFLEGIV